MISTFSSQIDSVSEYLVSLKNLKRQIASTEEGLELGLLQQFLDESSLYIKQIPRVMIMN